MAKLKGARRGSATLFSPEQLPMFPPESSWKAPEPSDWPDFSNEKVIGFDTETDDPRLHELGPGFIRGDARVCGISLAGESGRMVYLPIGHCEGNVNPAQAKEYVRIQLGRSNQIKVGTNVMYDLEALWSLGIDVEGSVRDIQVAEPLLDEESEAGYSLEVLSMKYLGIPKKEELLVEAGRQYGFDPKKNMSALPAKYVGPYAEADAVNPIQIMAKQLPLIMGEDLRRVFDLETKLTRVLFAMRLKGVRVDLDKADEAIRKLKILEDDFTAKIRHETGRSINVNSSEEVGAALEACGLAVKMTRPKTGTPKYSVTADWLRTQDHPVAKMIHETKQLMNMRTNFIQGFIVDKSVNGRLHTNWHQLRDMDESEGRSRGTRSGRIASSKPNLTQVPSRHPVYGKLIRSMFVADHGRRWTKCDYSQQEPRWSLHFALLLKLPGAQEAVDRYIADPGTDYHQMVADLVLEKSGRDIGRRNAKDINLGGAYGMGKAKLARNLGVTKEVAEEIFTAYHLGIPYGKKLSQKAQEQVAERGYIKTILGRRRRFSKFERKKFINGEWQEPVIPVSDFKVACDRWGRDNVVRAFIHKALNACIQGSAADQMKQALVNLYEEDLTPSIQVYDEVNGSYDTDEQSFRVAKIMEDAIPCRVPFKVDPDVGVSWGEVKELVYIEH